MEEESASAVPQSRQVARKGGRRPLKAMWKAVRAPLARSRVVKGVLVWSIAHALRFIGMTNPRVETGDDLHAAAEELSPAIVALWHGQHLLAPIVRPRDLPMTAMFSRSADAELNALVAERLGFGIVRGSGGRFDSRGADKGGARALIILKRLLDEGTNVAMIADIPHGTPREAGLGIVTLAKISGRPIVAIAVATSRRKVLEKSWDKTTINLPFGRSALTIGEPIEVPADADGALLEQKRRQLTQELNRVTDKAYQLVDGAR
jgi:lysophospholipid acyltransferase (LPLAT)-like uncharacterized protein